MRLLFLTSFFTIAVIACNSSQDSKKQKNEIGGDNTCFVYPTVIDSSGTMDFYDSARWYIYTWHCDENYLPKTDSSKSVTFGELQLNFDNLIYTHDTLELNFVFLDNGKPILPSMTRDNKELNTGVAFNRKTKEKIYMFSPNGYSITASGGNNRYENPLQPKVLMYIKANWNRMAPCFKELAERKGVLR